jgi:hypothetical protein
MPFRTVAAFLREVLPLSSKAHASTVRNRMVRVGKRLLLSRTCYEAGGAGSSSRGVCTETLGVDRATRCSSLVRIPFGQDVRMEWVIHVECRLAGQVLHRKAVASITRQDIPLRPEHVGLTLGDGKTVLSALQRAVVTDQVEVESAAWWTCPHCRERKRVKDRRRRRVRTAFGQVEVYCRRYHRCTCRGGRPGVEWPLSGAMPTRRRRSMRICSPSGAPGCRIGGPQP